MFLINVPQQYNRGVCAKSLCEPRHHFTQHCSGLTGKHVNLTTYKTSLKVSNTNTLIVKRKFSKVALIGSNPTVAGAAERCKL